MCPHAAQMCAAAAVGRRREGERERGEARLGANRGVRADVFFSFFGRGIKEEWADRACKGSSKSASSGLRCPLHREGASWNSVATFSKAGRQAGRQAGSGHGERERERESCDREEEARSPFFPSVAQSAWETIW